MAGLLQRALADPVKALYYMRARIDRAGLLRRYENLCRTCGVERLYFILSFDCDTVEDIEVAWEMHGRLAEMGVTAVWAVPGELLEKGEQVYGRIAATGAEFINHGYKDHARFDERLGGYVGCFFYEEQTLKSIEADMAGGDRAVLAVTGRRPAGFRTPHFPTFQRRTEIQTIHRVCRELGYSFSTSTLPFYAFRHGPIIEWQGIREIPLSGMWSRPLSMLDSWSCFRAPDRRLSEADYSAEGAGVARYFGQPGRVGVLNYYVDPSHVMRSSRFFETVRRWAAIGQNVDYATLLRETGHGSV